VTQAAACPSLALHVMNPERRGGITAVPTHLCGGKRLTGFAAYDDFVRLIGENR